jgi:hypothetical protein
MPTNIYGLTLVDIFTAAVDTDTVTWNAMLISGSYTPNFDTDHFLNTTGLRSNEVAASGSYAANGTALTNLAVTYVAAASAGARANTTAYSVGELVRPSTTNGHVWRCVVAGTSAGSEPAAITTFSGAPGQTVTDGSATWAEAGRGYVRVAIQSSIAWTSATITARYLVIANFTPVTDATRQVLACIDFGSNQSSSSGTFTVTFDTQGLLLIPIPS